LTEKEVDIAESQLEVDKTVALIRALASQQRFALQACYAALARGQKKVSTARLTKNTEGLRRVNSCVL